jgi:hypothetical protein
VALDSRNKRASAINVGMPWRMILPIPDGNVANEADRKHTAYQYAGITNAEVPEEGAPIRHIYHYKHHH